MPLVEVSDLTISGSEERSRAARDVGDPHHAAEVSIAPRNPYSALDVLANRQAG